MALRCGGRSAAHLDLRVAQIGAADHADVPVSKAAPRPFDSLDAIRAFVGW